MPPSSHHYSTTYKQEVVNYYITHQPHISFRALATLFHIKGGHRTVSRWYKRRNSLETKPRTGRPTILNQDEINTSINARIVRKNHKPTPVHYTDILEKVKNETRKNPSLRTIQRYGHTKLGIKNKQTAKRTANECKQKHLSHCSNHFLFHSTRLISFCSFFFAFLQ